LPAPGAPTHAVLGCGVLNVARIGDVDSRGSRADRPVRRKRPSCA
jgi:hypothetical protein